MLIAVVLFGFASVSGPTMATHVASGDFWTVADSGFCLESASIIEKAPNFKPCSKKINGHAVSCQQMTAILPLLAAGMFPSRLAAFVRQVTNTAPIPADDRHFRPPQVG